MDPNHRDFLRFLWFEDNKLGNPIAEYQMNVHPFGNGPIPAVATFGLRRTATDREEEFGENAMKFVHRNFYVDDGLASTPNTKQAIALESLFKPTCVPEVGGGEYYTSPTNSSYDGGGSTCKACSPEENGRHPDKP